MRLRRALVIAVLGLGIPLSIEVGFRLLEGPLGIDRGPLLDLRALLRTGRPRNYVAHPYSVFVRPPWRTRVNAQGFADEEWTLAKDPGVVRVLCLGASTTEGGNADSWQGSYPYQLEQVLEQRTGRRYEVMNAGMSGWTTAEMLTSWFLLLRDYAPDVLVLHEGVNDLLPRFQDGFRSDYSHWRRSMPSAGVRGIDRWLAASDLYLWLRLRRGSVPNIQALTSHPRRPAPREEGDPLPLETSAPFTRNLACIARDARHQGARVVCMTMPYEIALVAGEPRPWRQGLDQLAEAVRALARDEGLELVDAARAFEERAAELRPEFLDLVHLQPPGNRVKAELLADRILAEPLPAGR